MRDRRRVRRHGHRRHRPRPHRQGRRLPPRRDGLRRLPRHLPHGRDRPEDWHLLPDVPEGHDAVNLDADDRGRARAGRLHHRPAAARHLLRARASRRPTGAPPRAVMGVDGVERRWVYLHYFKAGQPSINWLDPSFAGMRLVIGDALHSLADLGSGALRLDANGFLGRREERRGPPRLVGGPSALGGGQPADRQHDPQDGRVLLPGAEPHHRRHQGDAASPARTCPTTSSPAPPTTTRWSPATPSSCGSRCDLALRARHRPGLAGPRAAEPRRADARARPLLDPAQDDVFTFRGEEITGGALARARSAATCRAAHRAGRAYNRTFTTNGIACTTASVITAALGSTTSTTIDRRRRRQGEEAPPAAGDVQRAPARRLRAVGLGSVRDADPRRRDVADLIAEATRAGSTAARTTYGRRADATRSEAGMPARPQPLRHAARATRGPPSFASRLSRSSRSAAATGSPTATPGRRPRRLAPRDARDGQPARRRARPAAGHGPELLRRGAERHGALGAPAAGSTIRGPVHGRAARRVDDLHSFSLRSTPTAGPRSSHAAGAARGDRQGAGGSDGGVVRVERRAEVALRRLEERRG